LYQDFNTIVNFYETGKLSQLSCCVILLYYRVWK